MIMHIEISVPNLLALTHLFVILTLCASYKGHLDLDDSSIIFTNYNRAAEIQKHCSSFLSLASNLSPDANRVNRIKRELSFSYGDWDQEDGHTTLMPFNRSNGFEQSLALKLVSFKVVDISSVQHFENTVSLGGIMSIGISGEGSYFPTHKSPSSFTMRPGLSLLRIAFEGVYLQSNDHENGKEHLLCLLGNTTLPIPEPFNYDWNDRLLDYSLLQDDQILLVLRYPHTFNLTRRSIRGEMRSLNQEGSLAYFENVHISSQLNHHAVYQFSPEAKFRSCDFDPFELGFAAYGANSFNNGSDFCSFLQKLAQRPFYIGPSIPGREFHASWKDGNSSLIFQHLICEEETDGNNVQSARVSAVLRAFPASMPLETVRARTGLSDQPLSAEGRWNSLTGKLCMVGCLGVVDSELGSQECNSQISLYFPNMFSIKQRNLILGSIHSDSNTDEMELGIFSFPLWHSVRSPRELKGLGLDNTPYYNYSKVELAAAIKSKNQHSKLFTLFKKLFFKYATLVDGDHINRLSNKLNVNANAIRHQSSNKHKKVYIKMEVLSLGTSHQHERKNHFGNNPLLNISLHLTISEGYWDKNADRYPIFLEGVYDPLEGDMHLVGCRMLSYGQDCLVEVKVQYPSESISWLKNPSVEMIITSQRSEEEDPRHFKPITFIISHDGHEQDYAFRKIFEGVLRLLISLAAAGIIWSQIRYMNANEDQTPYMSLGTLNLLMYGFGAELIRGSEILFESKESASFSTWPYPLQWDQQVLMKQMETITKLLVLVSLLLTKNLHRKVSDAKNKANAYGSNKPKPFWRYRDTSTTLRYLRIFICFCLILLCFREGLNLRNAYLILPAILMGEYIRIVLDMQNFFLIPQIFEIKLWSNQVKPLRKTYYFGLTLLRLVLFFYDYIRDPVLDPLNNNIDGGGPGINNQVGSDLISTCFSMFGPMLMIVLAFVVYIQQSWNYLKPRND